jgi:hypothetical protein
MMVGQARIHAQPGRGHHHSKDKVRAPIQRMASYFLTRLSALAVCRLNIIQYHRQTKKGRQTMPTAKEGDCG